MFKISKTKRIITAAILLVFAIGSLFGRPLYGKEALITAKAQAGTTSKTEADYLGDAYHLEPGHVFVNVTYERLKYILGYNASNANNAGTPSGNYAIVFAGPENKSSQAAIPYINEVAKKYGIKTVYHFDPKIDGDKLDITSGDTAIPSAFRDLWSHGTNGIKSRLKNSDQSYTSGATYLFIYNKTHVNGLGEFTPVVAGYVSNDNAFNASQADAYKKNISDVFDKVADSESKLANVTQYPFFDYFQTRINGVIGTSEAYSKVRIPDEAREGFTIQTVTYPELLHILQSDGDYAIFFGGTWCPYTSPTDNLVNTIAKKYGVSKIYQFDMRLDGNNSATNLKTVFKSSDPDVSDTILEGSHLYGKLTEYLSNLYMEESANQYLYYPNGDSGQAKRSAINIGVPFLLEYNKNHTDDKGDPAPVVNEWLGYRPFSDKNFHYAWYQRADVANYLNDPGYRVNQLGRPVDPDSDVVDISSSGANSVTLALPALEHFYSSVADNRKTTTAWDYTPPAKTQEIWTLDSNGGCGNSDRNIDLSVEEPILGQNGNSGYDVQNYDINVYYAEPLNNVKGSIRAGTVITAKAVKDLEKIELDFRDLTITDLTVNDTAASYEQLNDDVRDIHKLIITPAEPISNGNTFHVKVNYRNYRTDNKNNSYQFLGQSTQGFVPSANSNGATVIGEPNGSTFWFPSNNNTTDRATYTVTLSAPSDVTGVSIGNLVSREAHGTTVVRKWQQTQPTIPYLVFASFGNYEEFVQNITLSDGTKIPAYSYVDKSIYNKNSAAKNKAYWYARDLQNYIQWIENKVGKYPGETAGFVFENLKDGDKSVGWNLETVGRPFYSGIPKESTFVHELLHQWFGDSLTIAGWKDLWLNEGFASFISNIYYEEHDNKTETTNDWYREWFHDTDSEYWAVSAANPKNANNLFGDVTYGRGSFVLAALRKVLGDEDFFNVLKEWADRYAGQSVNTAQFTSLAAEVSNVNLSGFFQSWLYDTYPPDGFPGNVLPKVTSVPTATATPGQTATGTGTPTTLLSTVTPAVTTTPVVTATPDDIVSAVPTNTITAPPATNKTAYVPILKIGIAKVSGKVTISSKTAAVYKKASTKKGKLTIIRKGGKVTVQSVNGIYAKVKVGKKYGYIKVENLKFYNKQTGKALSKTYAYEKASEKGKKLKTYSKNTKLTLNSRYGKYYKIVVRVAK